METGRPRVYYHAARSETDPFPEPSLLDPLDEDQQMNIRTVVDQMIQPASYNDLYPDLVTRLRNMIQEHIDIFRLSFSASPPAGLPPLKIALNDDSRPVLVKLRNNSQEQKEFLRDFVSDLVRNGMAYPNPSSKWAAAPLLVPKPDAKFRFTVDLRPVKKITIRHQYPIPNIEQELTTLGNSTVYARFDLSHGY